MKIKELIKILEQYNPNGEVVRVYDCMRRKLETDEISVYNGKMPFEDDVFILSEKQEKNLSDRDSYNSSWALIIENK